MNEYIFRGNNLSIFILLPPFSMEEINLLPSEQILLSERPFSGIVLLHKEAHSHLFPFVKKVENLAVNLLPCFQRETVFETAYIEDEVFPILGLFLKGRICSSESKFYSLRVDP